MGARTVMHASVIRQIGTQYNKFVFVRATCMGHWDVDDRCALIYASPSADGKKKYGACDGAAPCRSCDTVE